MNLLSHRSRARVRAPYLFPILGPLGLGVILAGGAAWADGQETNAAPAPAPTCEQPHGGGGATQATEHHGALVSLIAAGLSKVNLSDAQKARVDEIAKTIVGKEKEVIDARRALMRGVIEQLKAPEFDETALKGPIDDLVKARKDASPTMRGAIEDLHGLLDVDQRSAFVDAIKERLQAHQAGMKHMADKIAQDLALTPEQTAKLKDVLSAAGPALESGRTNAQSVFDAFKSSDFSMERVAPISHVATRTRERAEGMVGLAKKISKVLTPEQRTELASKIEEHMQRRHGQGCVTPPASTGGGENVGRVSSGWLGYGFGFPYYGGFGYGYGLGYPFYGSLGWGIW
jgi:Spy/CpxP family protein refolding chaperone